MIDGLSPEQVAVRHGIGIGTVYTTKSRVLARLRDEIERIEREELADY
jgi:DNA-binding CsgD family transcriptional regulator